MLCSRIIDSGVESKAGEYEGIGLISATTRFTGYTKTTTQVSRSSTRVGPILSRISDVSGYEIHMGDTESEGLQNAFTGEGVVSPDGLVIGTYMHGLFTNKSAAFALVSYLCEKKGAEWDPIHADEADPFDALADHFEMHLNMDKILRFFP